MYSLTGCPQRTHICERIYILLYKYCKFCYSVVWYIINVPFVCIVNHITMVSYLFVTDLLMLENYMYDPFSSRLSPFILFTSPFLLFISPYLSLLHPFCYVYRPFLINIIFHFGGFMCKYLLTGIMQVQAQIITINRMSKDSITDEEYASFSSG